MIRRSQQPHGEERMNVGNTHDPNQDEASTPADSRLTSDSEPDGEFHQKITACLAAMKVTKNNSDDSENEGLKWRTVGMSSECIHLQKQE
jgi:hypothetical protein